MRARKKLPPSGKNPPLALEKLKSKVWLVVGIVSVAYVAYKDLSRHLIDVMVSSDYLVFEASEKIAKTWVGRLKDKHNLSNVALVLLKNDFGEIISMLGGVDYFDATNAGQIK